MTGIDIAGWEIQVVFIEDYYRLFNSNERSEMESCQLRFAGALERIITKTGIVPRPGDWIQPLGSAGYSLDIGKISSFEFRAEDKKIVVEIE